MNDQLSFSDWNTNTIKYITQLILSKHLSQARWWADHTVVKLLTLLKKYDNESNVMWWDKCIATVIFLSVTMQGLIQEDRWDGR